MNYDSVVAVGEEVMALYVREFFYRSLSFRGGKGQCNLSLCRLGGGMRCSLVYLVPQVVLFVTWGDLSRGTVGVKGVDCEEIDLEIATKALKSGKLVVGVTFIIIIWIWWKIGFSDRNVYN